VNGYPRLRKLGRVAAWLVAGFGLLVVMMMFLEESLIFFPARYPAGEWEPAGLVFEDAWFETADGTRLHGWFVPHADPCAAILFCHGNAGNLSGRADVLRVIHDRVGAAVLIFDYRGYGRSEGSPNEQGVLADARAARAWLGDRAGIAQSEVVLLGRSIGAAVAVDLAAADGARALVLESTFTSLPDLAALYYPWLPVRWLMRNRFNSLDKIGNYHGPLLQSHGDADTIVPLEYGRRLFEAANEPKEFLVLHGEDHNDFPPLGYYDQLRAFLEALPDSGESAAQE